MRCCRRLPCHTQKVCLYDYARKRADIGATSCAVPRFLSSSKLQYTLRALRLRAPRLHTIGHHAPRSPSALLRREGALRLARMLRSFLPHSSFFDIRYRYDGLHSPHGQGFNERQRSPPRVMHFSRLRAKEDSMGHASIPNTNNGQLHGRTGLINDVSSAHTDAYLPMRPQRARQFGRQLFQARYGARRKEKATLLCAAADLTPLNCDVSSSAKHRRW